MTGRGRAQTLGKTGRTKSTPNATTTQGVSQFQKFRREQMRLLKKAQSTETNTHSEEPSRLIKQARANGLLNLSNRALETVPESVWKINDPDSSRSNNVSLSMDRVAETNWWDEVDITKLILASNKLKEISGHIGSLISLTVLDLHDNALTTLPGEIGSLENLVKLNVNHNRISSLPESMQDLLKMKSFTAAHNSLKSLESPPLLSRWDSLDELDVSHNALETLPSDIGYLSQLTRLCFSHNVISSLPSELSFLRRLTLVELSHNKIKSIGDTFSESSSLEQLYLQNNEITDFPILHSKLKELHLGHNNIQEIPSESIMRLGSLVILDLKFNQVPLLPEEFASLQSLERLDLANNRLSDIPPIIGTLPNLMSLVVEGKLYQNHPKRHPQSRCPGGERKDGQQWSGTTKTSAPPLPPTIPDKYAMRTTRSLSLNGACLSELPNEAVNNAMEAKDIFIVDLSKNAFTNFPMNLEPILGGITELNLSQNRLESLPESLSSLAPHLEYINLSNNRLSSLTYAGQHLREINLTNNKFPLYPKILILSENKLAEIPVESLSRLKRLATLDISYNEISSVPPQLGN
ncbi:Leucinerich repeatcontaining protein 40like, partial [Caligus rogercresseyi]